MNGPLTVHRIASITKSFTALAVLQLAELGKVDIDSTVGAYLPDLLPPTSKVTIRSLLTHTSGISNYTGLPGALELVVSDGTSLDDILALINGRSLEFQSGSAFSYINSGYFLLGLVIEEVTGQTTQSF